VIAGFTASGFDDPMPLGGVDAFDCVLRGLGAPAAKSVELLSVSVAPSATRSTAVVFDGAGVGPVPSKQFAVAPKPAKSTSDGVPAVTGHPIVSAVVVERSATLPAVPLIAIVPVASGVGSGVVPPAPCASCTRKYCPG